MHTTDTPGMNSGSTKTPWFSCWTIALTGGTYRPYEDDEDCMHGFRGVNALAPDQSVRFKQFLGYENDPDEDANMVKFAGSYSSVRGYAY